MRFTEFVMTPLSDLVAFGVDRNGTPWALYYSYFINRIIPVGPVPAHFFFMEAPKTL